jgi:predicted nucleic acid-binding protein
MFRKDRISLRVAQQAMAVFDVIPIRYLDVDFKHSLKLAHDNELYAYDAYFLDCAIRYKAPLLSLDGQMTAKARDIGIDVWEVRT